jgi:predicted O-linked N-acetylglucosamine transferase (SPINDLY family)
VDEALVSFNKALSLKPDYASAHNNRGNALLVLDRLEEALASYDKALSLTPNFPDAYFNRGNVLNRMQRVDEALVCYGKALSLRPNYPDVYNNRGNVLLGLGRLNEALADYEKLLSLRPDFDFVLGTYLNTKMTFCDWRSFPENIKRYRDGIAASRKVTIPFPSLCLLDDPALHKTAAEVFTAVKHPRTRALGPIRKRKPDGKIRIGYYSADFREHAMTYLMAGLYEAHDAGKFEICGFSIGPYQDDRMRRRVAAAFHKFFDVRDRSDRQIVQLSREMGIDIAVDLNGHTQNARPGIFAEGCAPVQVNYLGYPGTMGADYIDYIMVDKTVLPAENQPHFTEKAVYLPHCYQVNDSKLAMSDKMFTRGELGLPERGFVFCCFNNGFKILPTTFDGWMRILKAVGGSVLWLLESNQTAADNLRKEAAARGVDGTRLVFARRKPVDEHLARYKNADLFIDTLPYNAHTTTSDALRVGLPVLTCMGHSFAARVAASLLNTVGLPEMITRRIRGEGYRACQKSRCAARGQDKA